MSARDREALIEAAATAHRPVALDGSVGFHAAFHDLDAAGREVAFVAAMRQRWLEAVASSDGLSATSRAVLRRLRGLRGR
jgi:hypothetical protein